jgi:hypothetical protein
MIQADLHMHSRFSLDGELEVEDIVSACKKNDLFTISITDHNLVKAIPAALKYGALSGIHVIPGIEIDCRYNGIDLHVLGYNINWTSSDFSVLEESIRSSIMAQFPVMIEKLSGEGIEVSLDEVLLKAGDNLPSGELIAEVLLGNPEYSGIRKLDPYRTGGQRSDMPYINFYHDFFAQGRPAYVKIDFMEFHETIALIRRNQGVPVIAHPGLNLKGREEVVMDLLDNGAEGLEVFNNYHTRDQISYFARTARERKVLMTCGSDFHGKTKPLIKPGVFKTVRKYEGYVGDSIERLRLRLPAGQAGSA